MRLEVTEAAPGIALLTMDDGHLNLFDVEAFRRVDGALADARDAAAVVLTGRPGVFSAGLDLARIQGTDRDGLTQLIETFGRTMMRIWTESRPIVVAATGHAVAAGTMIAMAADHAIAAEGTFRWGLTETAIGFGLPRFAIALARANVRADRLEDLLLPGEVVDPATAVAAGFADELAPPEDVVARSIGRAERLAALPARAYAEQKRRLRGDAAQAVLAGLSDDTRELLSLAD